jgi:hypothetical protein
MENRLPDMGYLVDFTKPSRGVLARNGIYLRNKHQFPDVEIDGVSFQAVIEADMCEGAQFAQEDAKVFRACFSRYKQKNKCGEDGAWCFPMSKLAGFLD